MAQRNADIQSDLAQRKACVTQHLRYNFNADVQ
jgi:hypothetical protein